jgi:hypothetical protein
VPTGTEHDGHVFIWGSGFVLGSGFGLIGSSSISGPINSSARFRKSIPPDSGGGAL